MENEFDGTLFFKGEGKKQKLYLKFTTRNNKTWENPIGENILSANLKQFAKDEKGEVEKTVKLQEQGGRPIAVYLEGETVVNKVETTPVDYSKKNSVTSSDKSRFSKSKDFESSQSKGESIDMPKDFHDPYNFVPAVPRANVDNGLGDDKPVGHDKFYPNHYTGKLTVRMTVKTPLVVLDTARVERQGDHKKFPVRLYEETQEDGTIVKKPIINPTAVKGMLRSAYEAVTSSRLSVFSETERLAFRGEASEALKLVPARIEGEKVFLYVGDTQIGDDNLHAVVEIIPQSHGRDIEIREMYAAWLGEYKGHGKNYKGLDNHKNEVWAFITKWEHQKNFNFWNVVELQNGKLPQPTTTPSDIRKDWHNARKITPQAGKWVKGFVCKTDRNFDRKHDERVFFMLIGKNPVQAKVVDFQKLKTEWKRLIENYAEIHKGEPPPKNNQGQTYDWSRPISKVNNAKSEKEKREETDLKDGTLCYAKVEKSGTDWQVLELYPVMISRRLHKISPADLLPESLKPATDINKLSPAERVFGWVGKGIPKNGNYRGQIRFGEITTERTDAIQSFDNDLPLNILGQPKPQQGRFYVAEDKNGNAQTIQGSNEESGYNSETKKGLRGRKVYPHHAHIEDDSFWFIDEKPEFKDDSSDCWENEFTNSKDKTYFREYLRPRKFNKDKNKIEQQRDSQNRSIEGWVKPKTEFQFDIHFTNLSEVELGALIWLLDLPTDHFQRFGGGKPLGFGSVKLEIVGESDIRKGKDLETFYMLLDDEGKGKLEKSKIEKLATDFENLVKTTYPTIIEAFKFACKGFDDKLPIHYPRTQKEPNTERKSFEWFVDNNHNKFGFKTSLPNLSNEIGLPINPKS